MEGKKTEFETGDRKQGINGDSEISQFWRPKEASPAALCKIKIKFRS